MLISGYSTLKSTLSLKLEDQMKTSVQPKTLAEMKMLPSPLLYNAK